MGRAAETHFPGRYPMRDRVVHVRAEASLDRSQSAMDARIVLDMELLGLVRSRSSKVLGL
jgi:hypothetical protein